jgi:hypothetical protein
MPRRRPRPRKEPKVDVTLTLTDEEWAYIDEGARQAGKPFQVYVVDALEQSMRLRSPVKVKTPTPGLKKAIQKAVAKRRKDIEELDEETGWGVVSVSQAIGDLGLAIDKLDAAMNKRDLEKAADIGYDEVAAGFIFLQRVLGEINSVTAEKAGLIQDICFEVRASYETVAPHVDKLFSSYKPRESKVTSREFARQLKKRAPSKRVQKMLDRVTATKRKPRPERKKVKLGP